MNTLRNPIDKFYARLFDQNVILDHVNHRFNKGSEANAKHFYRLLCFVIEIKFFIDFNLPNRFLNQFGFSHSIKLGQILFN